MTGDRPQANDRIGVLASVTRLLAAVSLALAMLLGGAALQTSQAEPGAPSADKSGADAPSSTNIGNTNDRRAKAIAAEKPAVLSLQDALMHDAASPVVGNPNGDVTIVAFVDYNCPYCKKSEADLAALIEADPKVRVIYKDFPILAKSSVAAAKIAIASAWQGKYAEVHRELMRMNARPAKDADFRRAVAASGADVAQLNRDLDKRDAEIVALLKRNISEADALKLEGTPVYLIGPYLAARPLDLPQFKKIVADARADQARAGNN